MVDAKVKSHDNHRIWLLEDIVKGRWNVTDRIWSIRHYRRRKALNERWTAEKETQNPKNQERNAHWSIFAETACSTNQTCVWMQTDLKSFILVNYRQSQMRSLECIQLILSSSAPSSSSSSVIHQSLKPQYDSLCWTHSCSTSGCLKKKVYPKIKVLSSFTHPHVVPVWVFFFSWTQKEIFWGMMVTKQSKKIIYASLPATVWLPTFFRISPFVFNTGWVNDGRGGELSL